MPQEQPESPLDRSRRHVAEAEAEATRLRVILRQMQAGNYPNAAEAALQLLMSTERLLSSLRETLRLAEQQSAGGPVEAGMAPPAWLNT
jgi:hypothetical protein